MARCLKMILLCAALALPAVASAHERAPRGGSGRWVEYGYSTYPRWDYPPGYRSNGGFYAPYGTPDPRVYVYASGTRVWYGPSVTPAYASGRTGYAYGGYHHYADPHHHGW
jgi:hypothetical protein